MPLNDVIQPEVIYINESLRLTKPSKEKWKVASEWYANKNVMYYSEGITDRYYELDDIVRMYTYLSKVGELYFIEIVENKKWIAIGDVTLSEVNLPIVIADEKYWGLGLGKQIISILLKRAKLIGIRKITIPEIYHYNNRSRNLFTSLGFVKYSENDKSASYELLL